MADDNVPHEIPEGIPEQTDNRPRPEDGEQTSIDQSVGPYPGSI